MNTTWSRFNITSIVLGFAFLYLPIVLLIIFSFNESKLVTVWGGFSTKWYVSLFHNQGLMDAAWVTIRVGLVSATVATVLGTMGALALTRYTRFVIESHSALRLRYTPATPVKRYVLVVRDLNKLFQGLATTESVLLKSNTRETLFRKHA